ncbi:hypothetical protein K523DRAFT_86887 [Schizophyllum commune Tattone D]|nr:hypothetical protein K523DRAFT_86887 [Schizophyllum commune Tattone D]
MGAISVAHGRRANQRQRRGSFESMSSPYRYRVPDAEIAQVVYVGYRGGVLEAALDRQAEGGASPCRAHEVRMDEVKIRAWRKLAVECKDRSRCASRCCGRA